MKQFVCLIPFLSLLLLSGTMAVAQDELPVREHVDPEQMVSLDQGMSYPQALDVIREFAREFRESIIIDRTGYEGSIGVEVQNMHWRDALDRIAAHNGFHVLENPEYFEVVEEEEQIEEPVELEEAEEQPAMDRPDAVRGVGLETHEVEIKATFFEGDRSVIRELGVDWSAVSPEGYVDVDHSAAQRVADEIFGITVPPNGFLSVDGWELSAMFNAFEGADRGQVIASPSIKVREGVEGRIQVGEDFSVRRRDFAGNVVEEFFETGTILTVTPYVVSENDTSFIYMEVEAERSSATPGDVSTTISKSEATTDVLLLSGETTVIGGLYETQEAEVRRGIPLLKDLPGWLFGLRYLFGYNSTDTQMTELVVVLQASVVPNISQRYDVPFETIQEQIEQRRRQMHQQHENLPDNRND